MRFNLLSIIFLAIVAMMSGCTDDDIMQGQGAGDETPSPLQFSVNAFSVKGDDGTRAAEPSPNPEPESEDEKKIENFWLFQFNPDGTQLAAPKYYTVPDGKLNDVTANAYNELTKNRKMTIYVVTNVSDETWVSPTGTYTLEEIKAKTLPSPYPIRIIADQTRTDKLLIPMSGQVDNVTVTDKSLIVVPVTRMYAKVKIQVNFGVDGMSVYDVAVSKIPFYCRVAPVGTKDANGEPAAVPIEEGIDLITRSFKSSDAVNGWITLYVPENLQGEVEGAEKQYTYDPDKKKNVPEQALYANIRAKYDGMDYDFTVYPGENSTNNFNVRRNCVYRVTIDIQDATDQHKPSSNCFVVKPNSKVTFEPYYRIEEGGGYKFSDYLNPNDPNKTIAKTEIIWQTEDCIGDNTDGSKVKFTLNEKDPLHSKLTVYTGKEGNALVGARNSKGDIIWSWHIWVTPNEPDNFANGLVYTTYEWDSKGIYPDRPRVPGYGIMPCNIGALAFRAEEMATYSINRGNKFTGNNPKTFGMLYQWGRKDPFPPMIYSTGTEDSNGLLEYTNNYTDKHFANDNRTEVNKTSQYHTRFNPLDNRYLFYSVVGQDQETPVVYSIEHPTVYLSGTTSTLSNSFNSKNGDWCGQKGSDRLWGGETGSGGLSIDNGKAHIYDNFGEKSIFDPCPNGWRVPPGNLWLSFSKTGLNPTNYEDEVNYHSDESGKRPGMSIYVQNWRKGPTVYFPLQGTRIYNGRCKNTGLCGNYHNATCDDNGRVNILHLHRNMATVSQTYPNLLLFKLFEYDNPEYYSKSTAGPIRCVRDSK